MSQPEDKPKTRGFSFKPRQIKAPRQRVNRAVWAMRLGGIVLVTVLWGSAWVINARAEEQAEAAIQMCVQKYPFAVRSFEVVDGAT